ncbi:MAG: hypothetical protein HKN30_01300 [Sulfitobacter sp.]|nr:hypothetical protein [Sulfitobacter sp.]
MMMRFSSSVPAMFCATLYAATAIAGGQTATAAELVRMVEIARDTCVATFPNYEGVGERLSAKGLKQDDKGTWRGPSTIIVFRQTPSGIPDCEVWMAKDSEPSDVSERLQMALPTLGVPISKATRKGVRLSATFQNRGAVGTLKVEPFNGRTSKIVVTNEAGT